MPSIPNASTYAFQSPNGGAEAQVERRPPLRMSSHLPVDRPHLAFVNATAQAAFATLDRVAAVGAYVPTRDLPEQRIRAGPARRRRRDGVSRSAPACSGCRPAATTRMRRRTRCNGTYAKLMGTLDDG